MCPTTWGLARFWWYAEARPTSGLNVWENGRYGLFDQNGNVLPSTSVFDEVNLPGDYNYDGVVDGADLIVLSQEFGLAGQPLAADGDRDGDVDGRDLLFWQRQFSGIASLGSAMVPEPTSLLLIILCGVAPLALRRTR